MADAPLIVGLGNELRGDDAAGLRVADLLRERGLTARRCGGEPIELLDLFQSDRGCERALIVDAVAGDRPGRIWRLEAADEPLPAIFASRASTHLIGLAETIELGRSLGRLPDRLEVIGIEGSGFALGSAPSAAVQAAIDDVAAAILAELRPHRPAATADPVPTGPDR